MATQAQKEIRVLVVEDDDDFARLILHTLQQSDDLRCVGIAKGRQQAVQMAKQQLPDVVLMDLNLSSSYMDGIDAAREIRTAIHTKIVILTVFENPEIILEASKRSFASGYLFKSQFSLLAGTLRSTVRGHTPQEWMIRSLILSDLSYAERTVFDMMMGKKIELFSSPKTLANQKTTLSRKLGLLVKWELNLFFGDY